MFLRHNLFWVIWTVIILFLSLTPGNEIPHFNWEIVPFDVIVHLAVYAVLSHSMLVGFNKQRDFPYLRKKASIIVIAITTVLGLLLEVMQIAVEGRFFDVKDIIANTIGVLFGVLAFKIIYRNIV
jgi:glycopeptide antibiotics resistance protein